MVDRGAEEELQRLRAELNTIYRIAPIALASLTADLEFLRVSETFAHLHRKSSAELVGKTLQDLIPGRAAEAGAAARQVIETGEPAHGLHLLSQAIPGPARNWEETWYAQRLDGETTGIEIAIVRTGTAEFTSNRDGQPSSDNEHFTQTHKLEALGRLAGGVAHDFNNLLTVLGGNLELIAHRPSSSERVQRLAAAALEAVGTGKRITEHLLAFARQGTLRTKVINVFDVLTGCRDLLKRAAGDAVTVAFDVDLNLWPCRLDPAQLETALLNLSFNAHDAMPHGGKLIVAAKNVMIDGSSYVLLAVTDTGEGMLPSVAARAFEPFFTTKPPGKGTGLGLSMVHGFAKQSGGYTEIRTAPSAGTTVELYFPRATEIPVATSIHKEERQLPASDDLPFVLVVEDDEGVLKTITELLTDLGYRTIEATTGKEALRVLQRRPDIELILTDVVMPGGMSGIDLAREARRLRAGIKVVLTSGYAEDLVGAANLEGDFPLISKPLRQADLAQALRALQAGANP
ncbi:MAG TPA: ATP-binding protein [Stellaceae bacterium]|nr:ATP-binding protein [Stellaceae bacterium]